MASRLVFKKSTSLKDLARRIKISAWIINVSFAAADPGFPVEGARTHWGR